MCAAISVVLRSTERKCVAVLLSLSTQHSAHQDRKIRVFDTNPHRVHGGAGNYGNVASTVVPYYDYTPTRCSQSASTYSTAHSDDFEMRAQSVQRAKIRVTGRKTNDGKKQGGRKKKQRENAGIPVGCSTLETDGNAATLGG